MYQQSNFGLCLELLWGGLCSLLCDLFCYFEARAVSCTLTANAGGALICTVPRLLEYRHTSGVSSAGFVP